MPAGAVHPNTACDECRVRKFKCSKERPSCAHCRQQRKECKYSPKADRTPLTRRNLTAAEDRISKLETIFAELLPNVNLNDILTSEPSDSPLPSHPNQPTTFPENDTTSTISRAQIRDSVSPGPEEALPQQADGFDWAEEVTLSGISDGMAALSIKPEGTGYLGATSSVMPLRALLMGDLGTDSHMAGPSGFPAEFQISGLTSPLSHLSEHAFIDAYFVHYHTTYPFLHEPTFRAQYTGQMSRPKGNAWPILVNTVLAVGAWCIGDENSNMDDVFYSEVNRVLQDASVFEIGNLSLVQALLLLSNYTQKRNKPNTGWNYLGLAVRMGLSLGLHKEFPEWKISVLEREMRRRVWWGIYIFDSGASITFGRPVLLPEPSVMDANQVLNIQEECLTPTTSSLPLEINFPTVYSSLRVQSLFHQTTNPLYHRLISNPPPTSSELLALQQPIDAWEESIPAYFNFDNPELHQHQSFIMARYRLSWRAWNLRIILFRPIVMRWAARRWNAGHESEVLESESQDDEQCRLRCLQSARSTIASIAEYIGGNETTRLGSWYMLYFLFQAGLIPIIFLITTPTSPSAPSWLSDLRVTRDLLSYASISNRLAGRCLEVIDRLYSPLLDAEEPNAMLQDPDLFMDVQSMFVGDQTDGMEFTDWSNFGLQWGV